jgi:hypothetical protein
LGEGNAATRFHQSHCRIDPPHGRSLLARSKCLWWVFSMLVPLQSGPSKSLHSAKVWPKVVIKKGRMSRSNSDGPKVNMVDLPSSLLISCAAG